MAAPVLKRDRNIVDAWHWGEAAGALVVPVLPPSWVTAGAEQPRTRQKAEIKAEKLKTPKGT